MESVIEQKQKENGWREEENRYERDIVDKCKEERKLFIDLLMEKLNIE